MIGKILILISLAASVIAVLMYFISNDKREKFSKVARASYLTAFFSIIGSSIFLLSNIFAHNFQFTYVWQYSSRELDDFLLASTFYAGQEGSFLLWTLLIAIIGFVLNPYARKHGYESHVMGFYSLILVFLTVILAIKSPFLYIWESFPDQGLTSTFVPQNGRGLNPVLENYWIVIHPPILFIGYSAMSVPLVFALAGLFKRQYQDWISIAMPWILFATGVLGLGIMLGGFWAYETLGWGGFWGWDPVENSSLLPWLTSVALVHTLLVQKRTGGLVKTNFFLAIISFTLVLYATFLTRSGVLGDSSVHSFVDPGQLVYNLLLVFLFSFMIIGFGSIIFRIKDISKTKLEFNLLSREFALSIGAIMVLISAVVVFIGTSWPIITGIFGWQKSTIEIAFYNQWNLPLIIGILLLNGLSIYLSWRSTADLQNFRKKLITALVISLIPTVITAFFGVNKIELLLLAYSAFFSLIVNIEKIGKIFKKPRSAGAYISHFGLSIMMLGVLASGPMSQSEHHSLKEGDSVKSFGYTMTLTGKTQVEKEKQDREKFKYNITLEKDGGKTMLAPIVYWSNFNDREAPFLEPSIKTKLTGDLYISPKNVESKVNYPYAVLSKGQEAKLLNDSSLSIKFVKFEMTRMMAAQDNPHTELGAIVDLTYAGSTITDTLFMFIDMQSGNFLPIWDTIPNINKEISFVQFVQNREVMAMSQAVFVAKDFGEELPPPTEVLNVEVSMKPFIWLVWVGVIGVVTGFIFSIGKYKKTKQIPETESNGIEQAHQALTDDSAVSNEPNDDINITNEQYKS